MDDCVVAPVSVVIPCFRCATSIRRAVASVEQQTLKPAEVILIDDASGDDTLSVLHELARSYPAWIRVIALEKNQGPASARNVGWEAATQSYLAFLDADDSWHPGKVRIQYGFMRKTPDVDISGHQCIFRREGEAAPEIFEPLTITRISAISLIFRNSFSTPTVMLKRHIPFRFEENKRYAEDLYLWQRVAFGGGMVMRMECPLAYMFKAPYGVAGLSAEMWAMEKGQLSNFIALYKARHISWVLLFLASVFSIAKYFKRLVHVEVMHEEGVSPNLGQSRKRTYWHDGSP